VFQRARNFSLSVALPPHHSSRPTILLQSGAEFQKQIVEVDWQEPLQTLITEVKASAAVVTCLNAQSTEIETTGLAWFC
jgi:hypothetical protein